MREVLLAEYDTVPGTTVHVDAGQSVELGVDPVQAVVGHICSERRALNRSDF